MPGHRVLAEIELLPSEAGGLKTAVQEGSRSLILRFDGDTGESANFGAVIERIEGVAEPGSKATVELLIDTAAVYATEGARFTLWYGRDVGHGHVTDVVPAW